MIRRRLPLPSSGTPFLSCFHLVTAFLKNISSKPFGIWAKKEREYPAAQLLLRRGHSRNLWALRPKKKSGRNLSCGHGNSTGNRKSLTIRVQVGILRTLRLSRHKQYAQISITRQLYHKILWLSRKQQYVLAQMYLRKEHFVHHHSRSKKISRMCRKIKKPPYFLSVRAFNPCTLTTEYPSGREIQQPRTVCDDMSVPTA